MVTDAAVRNLDEGFFDGFPDWTPKVDIESRLVIPRKEPSQRLYNHHSAASFPTGQHPSCCETRPPPALSLFKVIIRNSVASFLTRPDSTTRGSCRITKFDMVKRWRKLGGVRAAASHVTQVYGRDGIDIHSRSGLDCRQSR